MCIFCFCSTVKYNAPENISLSWSKTKLTLRWGAVENFPAEAEVRYRRMIDADGMEWWTYVSWVSSVLNIGFFCFHSHLSRVYINLGFSLLQWMANTTTETSDCELSSILHHVVWFRRSFWVMVSVRQAGSWQWICKPAMFLPLASWLFAGTEEDN